MKYLQIRGERKLIPGYPHHKDFVYRCYRFFEVTNIFDFLTIDGYAQVFRKLKFNRKYRCAVPRLLLIDPTSACNLRCKGCWAADYSRNSSLSYEKLDQLFTEAEEMGVVQIIMSGGEPLMRKDDIISLCGKHKRMTFGMFTNGTLIDEAFVKELVRIGNLTVFVSIEGTREETDARRGEGTYDKVMAAMDLLRKHDIGFAFSACYHSGNFSTIASDSFLDFMHEKGAWFGWLFNYLPIGSDADVSLCCSAEQRAYVLQSIEDYHRRNNFRVIDFANSGHKAIGCVAAGNDFAHINANGDLEPCAFCHYSDSNIHDMSLAEALQSQFFRKFRQHKPFSDNFLRPCPLIDVPDAMVALAGDGAVRSTHLNNPESARQLAEKTRPLAEKWKPVSEKLYRDMPAGDRRRFGLLTTLFLWGNKYKSRY